MKPSKIERRYIPATPVLRLDDRARMSAARDIKNPLPESEWQRETQESYAEWLAFRGVDVGGEPDDYEPAPKAPRLTMPHRAAGNWYG